MATSSNTEHEELDLVGEVRIGLFQLLHDGFFGAAVHAVEHLGHGAHAAGRRHLLGEDAGDVALQDLLDLHDDVGRGALHHGDALGHVHLDLAGQGREDGRPMLGVEMRQDERDGLRMLVLDEVEQLLRVGALDEVERRHLQRALQAVDDLDGTLLAQRLFKDVTRVVDTALADVLLSHGQLIGLLHDRIALNGGDLFHVVDLQGHLLYVLLFQLLEYFGADLGAQ
jgi:hypothetical protein